MGTLIKKTKINSGMKKLIEENALGFASINAKGELHNIAVALVKVIGSNQLLISDNYIEETVNNIKKNSNVALVVWAKDWIKNCIGYELAGKAEYFNSGKWIDEIKKIPENNGAPCKGAILVTVNKIKVLD
jgi:predicted pyridoxine 5'-phosphate oxidase superfamily flavin-nucleotide-binding protein